MNDSLHDASSEEYSEISESSSTFDNDPLADVHMDDDVDDDDDDSASFSSGVERSDMKEVRHLVQKETRHVQRWRCVVLLVVGGFKQTETLQFFCFVSLFSAHRYTFSPIYRISLH